MKTRLTRFEIMKKLGIIHCIDGSDEGDAGGGGGDVPAAADLSAGADGESGGIDWGGMLTDFNSDDDDAPETETTISNVTDDEGKTDEGVAEPAAVVIEPPAAATPPVEAVKPEPVTPVVAEAPAPEVAPAVAPVAPVATEAAQAEARTTWVNSLASGYQLSEEQALSMRTEPEKVLPQIAAEMHARVIESFMQIQRNMLPNMVQSVIAKSSSQQEGDKAFFGEWPELEQHRNLVQSMGQHWRSMNPQGTREQFIKQVGPIVWSAAGLSLQDLVNRTPAGVTPPAVPVRAGNPGGYSPAGQAASGGGLPSPAPVSNSFGNLAQEWLTEE